MGPDNKGHERVALKKVLEPGKQGPRLVQPLKKPLAHVHNTNRNERADGAAPSSGIFLSCPLSFGTINTGQSNSPFWWEPRGARMIGQGTNKFP
jgi:hypothetical protein